MVDSWAWNIGSRQPFLTWNVSADLPSVGFIAFEARVDVLLGDICTLLMKTQVSEG